MQLLLIWLILKKCHQNHTLCYWIYDMFIWLIIKLLYTYIPVAVWPHCQVYHLWCLPIWCYSEHVWMFWEIGWIYTWLIDWKHYLNSVASLVYILLSTNESFIHDLHNMCIVCVLPTNTCFWCITHVIHTPAIHV